MSGAGEPFNAKLPGRIFAYGEEPVGVRVTPYHKPCGIRRIINALDADEVDYIRRSKFGRFVDIADLPSFSGRFGRYIISRQLKVKKRHEVWFVFAGKPIRFSIREFASVTGLNCSKIPPCWKKKSVRNINEKPYWGELFGTLKDVLVATVIRMLERKTVTERTMRIKYACLALLASVILPTTHSHRISHDHAEMIKDLDEFFMFPWGRIAFEMLITSIKERNEISLSQNTIALKGFVLSLQLVMIQAVPALTEVVRDGSSSGSEGDFGEDEDLIDGVRRGVSPAHARDIDIAAKVRVVSFVTPTNNEEDWSDDEEDTEVVNMTKLIAEGFDFSNAVFTGGVTKAAVKRLRDEATVEAVVRKAKKQKKPASVPEHVDADHIQDIVKSAIKDDISRLDGDVASLKLSVSLTERSLVEKVEKMFTNWKEDIARSTNEAIRQALSGLGSGAQSGDGEGGGFETGTTDGAANRTPSGTEAGHIIQSAIEFGIQATMSNSRGTEDNEQEAHTKDMSISRQTDGNEQEVQAKNFGVPEKHGENIQSGRPLSEAAEGDGTAEETVQSHDSDTTEYSNIPEGPLAENDPTCPIVEDPTFSLGLTQEERVQQQTNDDVETSVGGDEADPLSDDFDVPLLSFRKSKRARVVTKSLVGEYACDKRLLNQARMANFGYKTAGPNIDYGVKFASLAEKLNGTITIKIGDSSLGNKEISQILERKSQLPAKIVDVLMHHTRSVYKAKDPHAVCAFLDSKFVSQLGKCSAKFTRSSKKDLFPFPDTLSRSLMRDATPRGLQRYYFPFYLDKKHWVGICADIANGTLVVLDCNIAIRSDASMLKELKNIAGMFPYLLRHAGIVAASKETKPMVVDRPRAVPQNTSPAESALTAVLLMQAHAVAGVEVCKCITPEVLPVETERLVVAMYEENVGNL